MRPSVDAARETGLLTTIGSNARTLWERVAEVDVEPGPPIDGKALAEALAPWARIIGRGEHEALERRLAWDGIDPQRGAAALAATAPATPPVWISRLEEYATRASRGAEGAARARGRKLAAEVAFAELWLPWVELALDELRRVAGPAAAALGPEGWQGLEGPLLREIAWLGEASAYEMFDGLRTAAGEARSGFYSVFVDFCLADPLSVVYQTYPVLARQSCRLVQQWVESRAELLARLAADRGDLGSAFGDGTDPGPARAISGGLSDRHGGGRQVLRVELASGLEVIYKPRDLGPETAYAAFLDWCRQAGLADAPPAPRLLRRAGYGWMGVETVAELPDRLAIERYGRRAGALLAIAHALGMADLHAENLVATADGAVVVDAEVLLPPEREWLSTGELAIDDGVRRRSILRSGLLGEPGSPAPRAEGVPAPAQRLDGLRVVRHREFRRKWHGLGSDDLRGEVEEVQSEPLPNVPRYAGSPEGAEAQVDSVVAGFETTYRFLLARRHELLAPGGPLAPFTAIATRVLLRPSQEYWRVLQLGSLPRNQRSGLLGSWLAEALLAPAADAEERPAAWPLVAAERQALERGDVPRFVVSTTGTLPQPAASPAPGVFAVAGLEAAQRRLASLSEGDLEEQRARLRWALGAGAPARRPSLALSAVGEELPLRCRWLALDLGRSLCEADEKDGPQTTRRLDLGGGALGPALFLAALRRDAESAEGLDAELASAIERRLARLRSSLEAGAPALAGVPPGGLSGLGSIVWGLVALEAVTGDAGWTALATAAADALLKVPENRTAPFDVDRGAAGAILGLLALHEKEGHSDDDRWLTASLRWGNELLRQQTVCGSAAAGWRNAGGLVQTGWSHGTAGAARALAALGRATGESRFLVGAAAAIGWERQLFSARERNWPVLLVDSRGRRHGRRFMSGYCRGAPGIALSRLYLPPQMQDEAWRVELDTALETTAEAPLPGVDHLCCGTFGRCSVLLTAGRHRLAERLATTALGRAAAAGGFAWSDDRFDNLRQPPGLLRGAAGVGYVLLRLAGADLPDVLALASPGERLPSPKSPEEDSR